MKKILFLSIPKVVYDRCLHDRCTDFGETANYLITKLNNKNITVDIFDGSVSGATNKVIYNLFKKKYDLIIFFTDVSEAHLVKKYCKILKYLSPTTKNYIYGDATLTMPIYFEREPFDAFHNNGDQEYSIYSYVDYLLTGDKKVLSGLTIINGDNIEIYENVKRLDSKEWAYPPLELLPINDYKLFSKRNKSIPYACSVYTSKGCPKQCEYCLCVPREGYVDRRRPIKELVDFLEKNQNDFEMFKMHSADFLLDKKWVKDFCEEIINRKVKIKWKITTCFSSIDEEIIDLIYKAGCVGIGFGIETFYKRKDLGFKLAKSNFERTMNMLSKYPIKYKGYVMIGVEGQSIEDVECTIEILKKHNVKVRPSTYTPFHLLKNYSCEELDSLDLENWNKKEFLEVANKSISSEDVYKILLENM